jgi:choline kinase
MKNALILCAGSARRFYPDGNQHPKCLLPLDENFTILDGLIRPLLKRDYTIVLGTGCGHQEVATHAQEYSGVRCIFNPDYATTNSIVTLWQLRDFVGDQTLIVNGDTIIGESAFDLFTDESAPQLLVKNFPTFDDDTYRVVYDAEYSVQRMGKELRDEPAENVAAFAGISRVGQGELFLSEIEKLLNGGTRDTWPTTAYKNLLGRIPVRARNIGSTPFFDVDTPEEFEAAKQQGVG